GLFGRLPPKVRQVIAPAGGLALRSSADPFLRDVLQLTPAPVVLGPVGLADRPPAITADPLRGLAGLDMVIDSGPTQCGQLCTRVRIDDQRWTIEREGVIDARTLTQMSGLIILFICTGNTCRSPMAEAICKLMLARRLDCPAEQIEERGYVVQSAGVAAATGSPAAAHAIDVLRAMGGSLESHRSRRVTLDLVHQADCIFAMTADHLEALLDAVPEVQSHSFLLDPGGGGSCATGPRARRRAGLRDGRPSWRRCSRPGAPGQVSPGGCDGFPANHPSRGARRSHERPRGTRSPRPRPPTAQHSRVLRSVRPDSPAAVPASACRWLRPWDCGRCCRCR